jgi:DNA-binding transcriptional LysR family regulator
MASQNLFVTQSTISRSIANLEKELGIKLFRRSRNGTVITDEGESIIKKANEILVKIQEIKDDVYSKHSVWNEELRISASPNIVSTLLTKTITLFKNDFPHVKINIMEKSNQEIREELKQNKIDLGIIPFVYPKIWIENDFIFEKLIVSKLKIIVGKHSPFANSRSITPYELIDQPFVIYDDNRDLCKSFINEFKTNYVPISILFTTNNYEIIYKSVANGLAFSFISEIALKNNHYVKSGDIIPLEITSFPSSYKIGIVRSKSNHFTKTAKTFMKYLKTEVQSKDFK